MGRHPGTSRRRSTALKVRSYKKAFSQPTLSLLSLTELDRKLQLLFTESVFGRNSTVRKGELDVEKGILKTSLRGPPPR